MLWMSLILSLFFFPTFVFASRYYIEETDMSLLLDDTSWYVFTRGNIENNQDLEELGVSSEYLSNLMRENFIYLDAVRFSTNQEDMIELFVRKKGSSKVKNLSNYSKRELTELEKELSKKQNSSISEIYENDYKFVYLEYQDSGYHLLEYYTIINQNAYTVTVQKVNDFTKEEKVVIKKILDSVIFELDPVKEEKKDSFEIEATIIGAIVGAIVGLLVYFQNRKAKITI